MKLDEEPFWEGVVPNPIEISFDNDGTDDVDDNLYHDNPTNMGDGWRIIPDKNSVEPDAPDHREVGFVVAVLPKVTGIPINLRLFDADDPTDYDGPIDDESKFSDNFGTVPAIPAQVVTIGNPTSSFGFARGTLQVSTHPGDNFRLVAAPRAGDLGDLRPITSQFDANGTLTHEETQGRLYRDEDGDQKWDNPNEPILDYDHSVGGMKSSELLTVWRRLNVEVDSIKTDPNENYVWAADDSQAGSVEQPDTSALAAAFEPAFIGVNVITSGAFSQNDLVLTPDRFDHFAFDTLNEMINFADANRQTIEDTYYWSAYVMGIYEYGNFVWGNVNLDTRDNDADNEFGLMGITRLEEREYSFIASEIIRDLAAENNAAWSNNNIENDFEKVKQLVVVHEIGHQFELGHDPNYPNGSLMSAPPNAVDAEEARIPEVPLTFNEADIKKMRDEIPGELPRHP